MCLPIYLLHKVNDNWELDLIYQRKIESLQKLCRRQLAENFAQNPETTTLQICQQGLHPRAPTWKTFTCKFTKDQIHDLLAKMVTHLQIEKFNREFS